MPEGLIEQLSESFLRFPGIGPRQARRFVYHLLRAPADSVTRLLEQIKQLKQAARRCPECQRVFVDQSDAKITKLCQTCLDDTRDSSLLMLLEKDIDLENLLRLGVFPGRFFVHGGLIKIMDQKSASVLRLKELLSLLEKRGKTGELKEIIVALSASPEGDATANYLRQELKPILAKYQLKFSGLGRGLSTGVEVEYSDADTLKNALKNRESELR